MVMDKVGGNIFFQGHGILTPVRKFWLFSQSQGNHAQKCHRILKKRVYGLLPEVVQCGPYSLPLNVFTAFKGSNIYISFMICKRYQK